MIFGEIKRFARIGVLASGLILASSAAPATVGPATTTGDIINSFRFTLADGTTLTSGNLRGRVVMVNFWASWCVPCRAELPLLNRYYRAHRADGLVIIGVAADPAEDGHGRWMSPTIGYPQAARVGGPAYRLVQIPMNYVIGRDGKLAYAKPGSFDQAKLDTIVGPLLKER